MGMMMMVNWQVMPDKVITGTRARMKMKARMGKTGVVRMERVKTRTWKEEGKGDELIMMKNATEPDHPALARHELAHSKNTRILI